MSPEGRDHSLDELTRGLASGTLSRGKALRLMGAALVGGTLASLGIGEAAADLCKRAGKACKKHSQCCSGNCVNGTCAECPAGTTLCDGHCVTICPSGQTLNPSTCTCCTTNESIFCSSHEECCSGRCAGLHLPVSGLCAEPCPSDHVMLSTGTCVIPCTSVDDCAAAGCPFLGGDNCVESASGGRYCSAGSILEDQPCRSDDDCALPGSGGAVLFCGASTGRCTFAC